MNTIVIVSVVVTMRAIVVSILIVIVPLAVIVTLVLIVTPAATVTVASIVLAGTALTPTVIALEKCYQSATADIIMVIISNTTLR